METQEIQAKKITSNDTIIRLVNFINSDKKDLFYKTVEEYISTLSAAGDIRHKLNRLLAEKPKKFLQLQELPKEIKSLITQSVPLEESVFLNDRTKILIDELLIEWKNAETYKFHNLGIRNKIIFHGVTGNGKTTIARHIARLTNLPFVQVNSDMVVDSHLGNSGMNIYNIFNKINEPCVLFWDEVDTIGRKRGKGGDSAASLENERMVNSVLVNLEKLNNDVIFICATNRFEVLDSAFLRRLDVQFELPAPSDNEKEEFAKQMIDHYKLPQDYIPVNISSEYKSYSEIKQALVAAARKYVLKSLK